MTLQTYLKNYKLPFDEITLSITDVSEVYKQSIKWFADRLQNYIYIRVGKPYLFGEDNHCYGTILDIQKDQFSLLFFPPDFPYFLQMIDKKDGKALVKWIQTIPLEYVPMIYKCLQKFKLYSAVLLQIVISTTLWLSSSSFKNGVLCIKY